jgi:hypothetical protein
MLHIFWRPQGERGCLRFGLASPLEKGAATPGTFRSDACLTVIVSHGVTQRGWRMLQVVAALMCSLAWAAPTAVADVTGRWRVTISGRDGAVAGVASLEQRGEQVNGWLGPKEDDTTPVSGVLKGDKLTLKTHPKPGFVVPFDTCELTVSADRMSGSIEVDGAKRTLEFVRTRQEK